MPLKDFPELSLAPEAMAILEAAESRNQLALAGSIEDLVKLAAPEDKLDGAGYFTVGYDVPGRGFVEEVKVCRVRNGGSSIGANYVDPAMRRRDPNCMVIADSGPTDKPTFEGRFGKPFGPIRDETLAWLRDQPIAAFFFRTSHPDAPIDAMAIAPANACFFALGLAMLQGILPLEEVKAAGAGFKLRAVLYIAPSFRHTHFNGEQVVVHNRRHAEAGLHELFSYNLYPGPSAKKGVYGVLLTAGEREPEQWCTAHCATVQVLSPDGVITTMMHEGASGGGKSEMLEHMHRQEDGTLLLGTNLQTGATHSLSMPKSDLRPVTDDMALCHPALQNGCGKLSLIDAESAWFVRVDHITHYGTDPVLEKLATHPPGPILFLNIEAHPGATSLLWEHVEDAPGKKCPNPRMVLPRQYVDKVVNNKVSVDIRSFGVRCPPCTTDKPTYGILGAFHVLDPSLAWLWRLVAPRGHANPSIVDQKGMQSEGVGSYWPFATGRKVDQANILLKQIINSPNTLFVLIPNQHIGAWKTGFAGHWLSREYLTSHGRSPAAFKEGSLVPARCPLLGKHPTSIEIDGQTIGSQFFNVADQPEVGVKAYDVGAKILTDFFFEQIKGFLHEDLDARGRQIIEACLAGKELPQFH